jgi:hypothetical protein
MRTLKKASLVITAALLTGCGTTAQFVVSESKVWNLQNAPTLNEVISTSISNAKDVAKKVSTQKFIASRKDKFETDEAFKARVANLSQGFGTAFFVKPLRTHDCTKYDFQKNTYNIACKAFRPDDKLDEEIKATGKKTQLANAYASREVEFFESSEYYISVATDAIAALNISSDDAKKIDRDLMVGVVISISSADFTLSGCGEIDVIILDDKFCKSFAFKSGAAYKNSKYMIDPGALLESVIYLKSTNQVLAHKKYTLQK